MKRERQLAYWVERLNVEGTFRNDHYETVYTDHFGFRRADFSGKKILDLGCGPRGSLEWADGALVRVGLDPLAIDYGRLGCRNQAMNYVAGCGEEIPFPDGAFDFVCSLNALDVVESVGRSFAEVERVLAPSGVFLMIVRTHEKEAPGRRMFGFDVLDEAPAGLERRLVRYYHLHPEGVFTSLQESCRKEPGDEHGCVGVISAKLVKRSG